VRAVGREGGPFGDLNPKLPAKDVAAMLDAEGFTYHASTPSTIRTDLLATLRLLQAAGHCRELELD
jgi:hypothetical protein